MRHKMCRDSRLQAPGVNKLFMLLVMWVGGC